MMPLADLIRNPVELSIVDAEGVHSISAERGPNGKVWLTCQCASSRSDGWCKHRVDLLCLRFDAVTEGNGVSLRSFENIVCGTALCDAGQSTGRALTALDECLSTFDAERPTNITGKHLGRFADVVSDLAACAGELEDAIGSFRRLLDRA